MDHYISSSRKVNSLYGFGRPPSLGSSTRFRTIVFFVAHFTIFAMFKNAVLTVIGLFLMLACNAHGIAPDTDLASHQRDGTIRFFYPSAGGTVEAYLTRPRGPGPFPLAVLLHGHSFGGRGGEQLLGTAETLAREACFSSIAISLPGYGSTTVSNPSVEDATREVVKDGIAVARRVPWIDARRPMLYGVSRGAIVAAAMINEIKDVSAAVLYAGAYDLARLYRETPSFWVRRMLNPNGEANPKLLSFLDDAARWRAPTLILHGEQDNLIPVNQSLLLRDQLQAAGTQHRLVLYPQHGHFLPRASVREQTVKFLKESVPSSCPALNPS
jgi:dipeptidyl aminopeptidase/acylaminoacyl peptidase